MRQRGVVLVAVLACVGLAGLLMLSVARLAATRRIEVRQVGRALQARWLAESALDRAAARLAADPGYTGETWTVSPDALGGDEGGSVRIEVLAIADQPARRRVRVQADYPDDPTSRIRVSKEITIAHQPEAPARAKDNPRAGDVRLCRRSS
ncbi:MAG: hypothetical protein NUV77_13750 [Thermoguttaceae bacterium]|jgi:type II secretory pathway pseudopilin PulG|nr:hypothetical protein [Thermoguttaceae bacterium]